MIKSGFELTKNDSTLPGYYGPFDSVSRLRHGEGTYQYHNRYFTFNGTYNQGVKDGQGKLTLGKNTFIEGIFQQGQLCGQAEIKYANGGHYKGQLQLGERCGKGCYESEFEKYEGQWSDNQKHGYGIHQDKTLQRRTQGYFQSDKPHGKCVVSAWGYKYEGQMAMGLKNGMGHEKSESYGDTDDLGSKPHIYEGDFKDDRMHGQGKYKSLNGPYEYIGEFQEGQPTLFPNQISIGIKAATASSTPSHTPQQAPPSHEVQEPKEPFPSLGSSALEYELEIDCLSFSFIAVYQGPEVLDEVQPSQEDIDKMIKDWQAENKKNKNPPPMPDFAKPRMKKPLPVPVVQERRRIVRIELLNEAGESFKIDYRQQIAQAKLDNARLKEQATKKAEEEASKKGGKKQVKGQSEYKVNAFRAPKNKKQKVQDVVCSPCGHLNGFELPDDFPPGKYALKISSDSIVTTTLDLVVKAKQAAAKKK